RTGQKVTSTGRTPSPSGGCRSPDYAAELHARSLRVTRGLVVESGIGSHDQLASSPPRRRSIRGRLAALAVGVALLASACLASAPGGLRNGYLPDSVLTTISPTCR